MIGSALTGGLLGALVLTTTIRIASELGLTRMDLALILGTAVTRNRRRARALGYVMHAALGIVFAFAYRMLFALVGWSTWWLGGVVGALHAVFLSTVVINVMLPVPAAGQPASAPVPGRMAIAGAGSIGLAWSVFTSGLLEPPGSRQNSAQPGAKSNSTQEAIARLRNPNASLSDRAWAARKLAETPAAPHQAAEVAPLLNPLLESRDGFHRDSAVLAIKQGWGSPVNEPGLRRLLQSTRDARKQQELTAALNRLGD